MKLMSSIAKTLMPTPDLALLCHYVMKPEGSFRLDNPVLSNEFVCEFCGNGKDIHTPFHDPALSSDRIALCGNIDCDVYTKKTYIKPTSGSLEKKRALLWPLFCEMNDIGDEHHGVVFEGVKQAEGKIAYMLKFANSPRGIIFMQGDPGTGKTYAAMAICEFFTRTKTSCIFSTSKQMSNNWMGTFKSETYNNYIERISNTALLVIDDFGTAEPPPGFLSFFMELINTRMQWKDRGTVITTNLGIEKFNAFCGEALSDRIMTGQQFEFKGKTRRTKTTL